MYFRRFVIFLAVFLFMGAIAINDESITKFVMGDYSVYNEHGDRTILYKYPLVKTILPYERVDCDNSDSEKFLNDIGGKVIFTENVDSYKIIYAHSDKIKRNRVIKGQKINIMIALKGDKMVVGSPLIMGSY